MAIDPARVKALFQSAIERTDPADRRAFLEAEAGGDTELLGRLEALLAAFDGPANALDRPMAGDLDATAAVEPGPAINVEATVSQHGEGTAPIVGSIVAGRYKVRQEIGEGGMGSVYFAEQTHPVRRQVALKLIKPGMDSRTILARFESERQALALMDHPNIAKVLDAGTTEHGRPYFVMELVKGVPLTKYCDAHRLDLHARLALFRQICSAVQHAHQKGIIHRDLKPTNILVESHDDKPVPKVIDFGLAKATSGVPLADQSLYTAFGSVMGTPLYMAPEQASFNALDIDTRADIYALGVILYEMLTGSTPIRRDTMKRAAIDEMLRLIREDEPPTPSSRISTSEGLPSIAAARHIDPSRLSRFVRGDLDWIVMKALAKERSRRYDSAIGLANDLERFANHEPVSAGPPTAGYRMRKFVRRNRAQVVAAAFVLVALVLGMMGTTLGLFEARRQEHRAIDAARVADQARLAEILQTQEKEKAWEEEAFQRQQAERRLAQVGKMNEILGSIFRDLDPKRAEKDGKPLAAVLAERLDRAIMEIEGDATGDPLAVAAMQQILGDSLSNLGYADKAIVVLTKALATRSAGSSPKPGPRYSTMNSLAAAYDLAGQTDLAVAMYERVLVFQKAKVGLNNTNTLATMNNLGRAYHAAGQIDRAVPMLEQAVAAESAMLGPDHLTTLNTMGNLGVVYLVAGQTDRALPMLEQVLAAQSEKLGPDHTTTLNTMSNVGNAYLNAGQTVRAVAMLEQALPGQRAKLGPDHPDTLSAMNNLAVAYQAAGQLDRALAMLEQMVATKGERLGPDHPHMLMTMNSLGSAYQAAGQLDRALAMFEQAFAAQKAKIGPDHPDTLTTLNNLGRAYQRAGQDDRALAMFEQVLAARRAKLGPDHPSTLTTMNNLGRAYQRAGQLDRALTMLQQTFAAQKAKLGPEHPDTLITMSGLGLAYQDVGQLDRALAMFEQAFAAQKAKLGPEHPDTLITMGNLGVAYLVASQPDRAVTILEQVLAFQKAKLGPDNPDTLVTMNNLAAAYLAIGQLDRALPMLEQTLPVQRAKVGHEHYNTLMTMTNLAKALNEAGQRDRALSLYRELVAIRKPHAEANPTAYAGALASFGLVLVETKQWPEAETILREVLTIRERKEPDAWTTFNARSMLGATLLAQGKTAEAEPLLRSGYEGMKQRAAKFPPEP